jgi:secreted PhoX family phosphatase
LTAEENFNQYFGNNGSLPATDPRKTIHSRYGVESGATTRRWELYHDRFDIGKEPNEPFRFGWVVEIDPYNPSSIPKKRTALGRTKHEAATTVIAPDGRVTVYSGDDERFDYMYKFITSGKFNSASRNANMNLLDSGILYVARFKDDGTGEWLPMLPAPGSALAIWTQAEICINTRGAADALGATKMDRPEDIEYNPVNGKVYAIMTNNTNRGAANQAPPDKANPRATNRHGHVIELTETGNDPTSLTFRWEIFLLCGDPAVAADATFYAGFDKTRVSAISCPDNLTFDARGNLWISTDGQPSTMRVNDGIYAVPVEGPDRGYLRQFMSGPAAAEICGPEFTPNNSTLFCAIQHPGEGGSLSNLLSHWPDGGNSAPRSGVIAISKGSGGSGTVGT